MRFPLFWSFCKATNICVQYNGGFLPDVILLTLYYYHRGTRLNAIKRFCLCSPCSHSNVLTIYPLIGWMLKKFKCVLIFLTAAVFHRDSLLYSIKTTAPEMATFFIRPGAKPFSSCAVDGSSAVYKRLFINKLSHTHFMTGHHFKSLICPYDVTPVARIS